MGAMVSKVVDCGGEEELLKLFVLAKQCNPLSKALIL